MRHLHEKDDTSARALACGETRAACGIGAGLSCTDVVCCANTSEASCAQ